MSQDVPTKMVKLPEELLARCRADESGVQLTEKGVRRSLKKTAFNPAPEIDALDYDPFEDQPTLVHEPSWRASVKPPTDFPLPLHRKRGDWLATLPPAARAVLEEAAAPISADAPRVAGAIAHIKKEA